jgi:hypothetical protein
MIKEFIATDQAVAQRLSDRTYVMICIEDSVGNIVITVILNAFSMADDPKYSPLQTKVTGGECPTLEDYQCLFGHWLLSLPFGT